MWSDGAVDVQQIAILAGKNPSSLSANFVIPADTEGYATLLRANGTLNFGPQ